MLYLYIKDINMIKLFTEEEYQNAKSEHKLPLQCENCKKTFYVMKKYITYELKHHKNAYKVCSIKCGREMQGLTKKVICEYCGKEFYKKKSGLLKTKHNFCSKKCAAYYNNAHKTYGFKRSKLELFIEEKLLKKYPNLEIIFNDRKQIGYELDIFIPSLKLAFELNGIYHYEPIYGNFKFQQIQERDMNKFQLCHKNNISLCIIDTSSQKYFKEQTSQKFLNIIIKIIDDALQHSATLY